MPGTLRSAGVGTAVQTLPQVPIHGGWIPHDATAAAQPRWLHERFAEWRNRGVARLLVTTGALQAALRKSHFRHFNFSSRFVQGIIHHFSQNRSAILESSCSHQLRHRSFLFSSVVRGAHFISKIGRCCPLRPLGMWWTPRCLGFRHPVTSCDIL